MLKRRPEPGAPDDCVGLRARPVRPDDAVVDEVDERSNRLKHTTFTCLPNGRHHDDVTETTRGCGVRAALNLRFPTFCCALKQHATVYVIWKKRWRFQRNPCHMTNLRQFGKYLRTGVAASDDEYALSTERFRILVMRGVHLLTTEIRLPRVFRDVRVAPCACCTDDCFCKPFAVVRR